MTMTQEKSVRDNLSTRKQRHIIRRIVVHGTLILYTPTCLGSGDVDSPTDLPLLRDSISERALLTGASIAGALRNYLREREHGYMTDERVDNLATVLFGGMQSDDDGNQSSLIIDDAFSTKPIQSELRDGVKINSITRTAADKAKYDLELLQAGTEFPLCLELLIEAEDRKITLIKAIATEMQLAETKYFSNFFFKWLAYRYKNKATLLKSLAIALSGLEQKNGSKSGEISLGMKKRRGFGRCHVQEWQVWNFNLEDPGDRMAWLLFDRECTKSPVTTNKIADALGVVLDDEEDKRDRFTIQATFKLVGSLLIRSGQAATGRAPDVVHLKSNRPGETDVVPVLSGTSLAGVLRHRAERIVKTLQCSSSQKPECDKEPEIVQSIFGKVENNRSQASRLIVHEAEIKEYEELVQIRIAIDRFTGCAYHGALFQEQPVFGGDETCVTIELELRQPSDAEIGLLLLLLKDLWTSDLPVGGESSIGRGRLKGIKADLNLIRHHPKEMKKWAIAENNGSLRVTNILDSSHSENLAKDELEKSVQALQKELEREMLA